MRFGIDKLDDIVVQGRPIYLLNRGDGCRGYVLRFCETRLLKNLLEDGIKCGVVNLSFGDAFNNLYRHQEGWKNNTVANEQTEEFEKYARLNIHNYPLYELKIYGNNQEEVLDYISNFLIGRVKYIFITNVYWTGYEFYKPFVERLFELAKNSNVTFIFRTALKGDIPENIARYMIDFTEDKETEEIYITTINDKGEQRKSLPMKLYLDDGIGSIE
jgi:hypothetical protein